MSILGKIFSGGAADLVKGVGGVIDDLHTSDEEKLAAENKIKELVSDYETKMEANITDRWKADMNSDSWLSKNVRPLVLVFLVVCTVLMIFIDAGSLNFVSSMYSINDFYRCWNNFIYGRRKMDRSITISINNSHWCLFWWSYNGKKKKN